MKIKSPIQVVEELIVIDELLGVKSLARLILELAIIN